MKRYEILFLIIGICASSILLDSCKKSEEVLDPCENVVCENGGLCLGGNCDCPDGYIGTNCEMFDPCFGVLCENDGVCDDGNCNCLEGFYGASCENETIQNRLDSGASPKQLFDDNVSLDSLYGKIYNGGFIFYLNTDLGTGLLASTQDQASFAPWGCWGDEINGADGIAIGTGVQNTMDIITGCSESGIAASLCSSLEINGYGDWFLPSRAELALVFNNLHKKGHSQFLVGQYWSSSEKDDNSAWAYDFYGGGDEVSGPKLIGAAVRPVRAF